MRPSLLLAALALLPAHALAQPAALLSRSAIPAPSGLVLVPGDSITVMHNGTSTATLLPSLGAFLGAAPPLASNLVPGLMRGDGSTLTVDPLTGIASVVGTAATPLTGPVLGTDTFLIVRGSGTSAVPYSVTVPQLTAALGGLADGTTLSWNATTHQLSVVGQTPTAASTVPSLAAAQILLANGTYLTGTTLQALLGISTGSSTASTATTYTLGAANSSAPVGTATTYGLTPTGGAWPSGEVLTPVASGISGAFNPTTLSPSGTVNAAFTFTPSAAGSGTISVTSNPALTNPAGVALTATAATPSPTPTPTATTYSFAGAAGAPTGVLALTQTGSNPLTGMALNGNGALLLPSDQFAYALFEGLPTFADGTLTINAASAPQPLNMVVFVRSNAAGSAGATLFFNNASVIIYGTGLSSNPNFAVPSSFTTMQVSVIGQVLTLTVDGAQICNLTATSFPASGFIGLGSAGTPTPQVQISSLQVTPQ